MDWSYVKKIEMAIAANKAIIYSYIYRILELVFCISKLN